MKTGYTLVALLIWTAPVSTLQHGDEEISRSRAFDEPLIPIGGRATAQENKALGQALAAYIKRVESDDTSAIAGFLQGHPASVWRASLLTNLGLTYRRTGHFSKALAAWEEAWKLAKGETELKACAVGDRAVGELADLTARLGRERELETVLEQVKERDVRGPATERLSAARRALWQMRHEPEDSFQCGPYALSKVSEATRSNNALTTEILKTRVSPQGMSLRQLGALAQDLKMSLRVARREGSAPVPVPSVVHWKLGHYGALVREENGHYLLRDPTVGASGGEAWISSAALDAEASGYFLIAAGPLPEGWHSVSRDEEETIWGRGYTSGNNPNGNGPNDPRGGGGNCGPGMASYSVHLMLVSLYIEDIPVGYAPPRGPDMHFRVVYSQREANQPAVFSYSNLGPKWTFDWLSYVIDDPQRLSANVNLYNRGGGTETYGGFDTATQSYTPQYLSGAVLRRTSATSLERRLPDGSVEIFARSDGATSFPRKIFMTRIADPYGNGVDLSYDSNLRLTTVTDPLGRATTLSYELPGDTLKITRVTDPFGRFATFEYNASGQLMRITDVIGMQSQFDYDTGDFIRAMTTPYGTTMFAKGEQGTTRFLNATDPLGDTERVEYRQQAPGVVASDPAEIVPTIPGMQGLLFNRFLDGRDTFYWDKKAWRDFRGEYTQAKMFHWLHEDTATTGRVLESIKEPLERRAWYLYPGQTAAGFIAGIRVAQPSRVARVLDDGTTQLYQFEYNRRGKVTRSVDPVGRELSSLYAFNALDLLEVAQTRGSIPELLAEFTYNHQHLPLTATDAAGQTTRMTYNDFGQVLTITNPKNETKTFTYDVNGYLISVEGAVPGSITRLTYDSFGRVRETTDSAGYTLTFDYDPLDRLVQITYPDGTSRRIVYNRLDPERLIDRLGRSTLRTYNARRQLIAVQDPAQRTTRFEWCPCGRLEKIIDPLNRPTTWNYDVQRRLDSKVFPDGSQLVYSYENTTSRLREIADAEGQTTRYQYYLDNTLRQVSYAGGAVSTPSISFTYDPNYSRVRTMDDGTGRTTYDYYPITKSPGLGAGKLASEVGPLPNSTITYQYDELGRVIRRAINGVSQSRVFDSLGRVAQVTNPLGDFALNYLDATNRLSSIDYPNGQRTTFTYSDVVGDLRLQEIRNLDPASAVLSRFNYVYDAEGRITSWTRQAGEAAPTPYLVGYDGADQLLDATPQGIASRYTYSYDIAGNRLTEQIDGDVTSASYNDLNQLIGRQVPALPDPDPFLRRSEVTYDGLGRRVRVVEREDGVVVSDKRFLWCGRELCEERDGSGAAVVKRFYPHGLQVNGESYFYARDLLRSIREMTDATGAVRARYDYDPYGRRTKVSGDLDADLGFAGLYVHSPTGLQLALYRGYDANFGRWISRDPIAEFGGLNLYAYVDNDPINFVDPTGLGPLVPPLHCDLCNMPPPPQPSPFGIPPPPPLSCPFCSPQPTKPLPCASGTPPYLPYLPDPGGGGPGGGGPGGGGAGDSPFGPPPPDPAGGPVGSHRADQPNFGGPPNGDPPSPIASFHFNFDTDPPGLKGAGGNIGSTGGDVDFDQINDAVKILKSLINQLGQ